MTRFLDTKTGKILDFSGVDGPPVDTDPTLLRMVRDRLASMSAPHRLEFMHWATQGYCIECGSVEVPGKLCACFEQGMRICSDCGLQIVGVPKYRGLDDDRVWCNACGFKRTGTPL